MPRLKDTSLPGCLFLVLASVCLASCCFEESSTFVSIPPGTDEAIARACRISRNDTEVATIADAVAWYHSYFVPKPDGKERQCIRNYGSVCEFRYFCDGPVPDMGALNDCPPLPPPPPRRYYACLGCGAQLASTRRYATLLFPDTSALLDKLVHDGRASTREEALHKAILHYEQAWLKKRTQPDFYKNKYNFPQYRKPDEPCMGQPTAEMIRKAHEAGLRQREAARRDMASGARD